STFRALTESSEAHSDNKWLAEGVKNFPALPCATASSPPLPVDLAKPMWSEEEARLRAIPPPISAEIPARVIETAECHDRPTGEQPDSLDKQRRAILEKLDEAKASRPRNAVLEAELLDALAATYDAKISGASYEIRREILRLLVQESAVGAETAAKVALCLAHDATVSHRTGELEALLTRAEADLQGRAGREASAKFKRVLNSLAQGDPDLFDILRHIT